MRCLVFILCFCLSLVHVSWASENYIMWVKNLKHHYEEKPRTQEIWSKEIPEKGIVNASFFKSNGTLIPPFSSETNYSFKMNKRNWWYIDCELRYNIFCPWEPPTSIYVLKSSNEAINLQSKFILSVCPPLIHNSFDISNSAIVDMGGRVFAYRNCRRTLIGKTKDGRMFIIIGTGNLFSIRENIKSKIDDIEWLANLDGGSSTFLTLYGNHIVKNKTKVPSVVSFDTHIMGIF